jgi:predicted DNA-binding transcriptional regulator AlpA
MTTLLTYDDLQARGIRFSKDWLRSLAKQGKFPKAVKTSAQTRAWPAEEVEAWLQARLAERTAA